MLLENSYAEMNLFRSLTVLSVEQATTLPFMTMRLAQEGARVIRIENPPKGDPNRWVGPQVLPTTDSQAGFEAGMNAYFLPNNLGKQSITLNLSSREGRELIHQLIGELSVDIFATNQRPRSLRKLGIDYLTLSEIKADLIWVSITGFGPESNEAAYDPILQARSGFMDITGEPNGEPMVFGLPIIDLGAGEHAYGQVMKALYRKAVSGEGSRVDISMFQSAVSWMVSPVLLSYSFDLPIIRQGNTHPFFAPVSVFPTADGAIYLAIGNDRQWEAVTQLPGFSVLAKDKYKNNSGRISEYSQLNQMIAAITRENQSDALVADLNAVGVPVSKVNSLPDVWADPLIAGSMIKAVDPVSGKEIAVPPPPVVSDYLNKAGLQMDFPPRLGEHNEAVYGPLSVQVSELSSKGII